MRSNIVPGAVFSFWGRPSLDDLWRDLRAATRESRPDRDPWAAGDRSRSHGRDRRAAFRDVVG